MFFLEYQSKKKGHKSHKYKTDFFFVFGLNSKYYIKCEMYQIQDVVFFLSTTYINLYLVFPHENYRFY